MIFQQKLLRKAYFIVKMTAPAIVRPGSSDFRKASKDAFHLSGFSGQTIPVVLGISLLIKTVQPDQSNPKSQILSLLKKA